MAKIVIVAVLIKDFKIELRWEKYHASYRQRHTQRQYWQN